MDVLTCIFCSRVITKENAASEHIIPNALGGRLTTYRATCITCNSSVGASFEKELITSMGFFANVLDVPRDRGINPDIFVNDKLSGLEYRIPPGANPTLSPNFEIEPTKERVTPSFFAPSLQEAEKILKKQILSKKRNRKEKIIKLTKEVEQGRQYEFTKSLFNFDNFQQLRAIVKIALCFTRQCRISTSPQPIAERFLRGDTGTVIPVAPVFEDIITLHDQVQYPLTHGLYIMKSPGSNRLFAYVVLFEAIEFVVLVDDASPVSQCFNGYMYNLITANAEERDVAWIANPETLFGWFGSRQISADRLKQRAASLDFWLKHKNELWIKRAMAVAAKVYGSLIEKGTEEAVARSEAETKVKQYLATHGLTLGEFNIKKNQ